MKHFRKIWDKPKHDFLMSHRELKIKECYKLFLKTFPDAQDVTETAFRNERSRIGAISDFYKNSTKNHGPRKPKPLLSEHVKKGYIRVKVEQPNKWMFKHHYVWWQNTGHKPEPKKETVIFLDGNNRNFDFHNLFLMPRDCIAIFNNNKLKLGIVPGNPEATRINATNAILIHKTFNLGRKIGLVSQASGRFKEDINACAKARYQNQTEEIKEQRKKWYEKLKNDPVKYEKYKQKRKIYYQNWKKNRHK